MKKPIILAALLTTVIGLSALGVNSISAQEGSTKTTFVQKLAQKLGIAEDKVETAMDEIRDEKDQEMQSQLETRLSQAVSDGKLTEAQKSSLLSKMKELQQSHKAMHEDLQSLTPEERKAKMQELKRQDNLRDWAESEGIDLTSLQEYMPFGGHGMKRQGMMIHGGF